MPASHSFAPDPRFPVGTVLSVYPGENRRMAPGPAATTTGTVGADRTVTFTGLEYDTRYTAGATVGGRWLTTLFTTLASPSTTDSIFAVMRENPLNLLDPRFGADNTGQVDSAAAINLLNAYVGDSYGAEVILPPGEYLLETNPTLTKPGINLHGIGRPTIVCEKVIVQADDFRCRDLAFTERPGVTAGDGRAIYVDPDGAGRDLTGFRLQDLSFTDFFYGVDFRGVTRMIEDIRVTDVISERVATGNAGHLNFYNCKDVETRGVGTKGGQGAASQNFGNCQGLIQVYGGNDRDNDVSGGALDFENFAASGKVQVHGGNWLTGVPSGTDTFGISLDDVEDFELHGVRSGGYVRVQTGTGIVRRGKIIGGYITRLRVGAETGAGSPQYVDELDVIGLTLTGVPGVVGSLAAFSVDGTYVRTMRALGCRVRRYQDDGTSENWANALSIVRGANLDLSLTANHLGGRDITTSGSSGTIFFDAHTNRNYGSFNGANPVVKAPTRMAIRAGTPVDADFDSGVANGDAVVDTTGTRIHAHVGTSLWPGVQLQSVGTQTLATDANFTLTQPTSPRTTFHTGTLTAARTVTLATTNAKDGMKFEIVRTGAGAFNLNVGSGPLKALATNQRCEVTYDGTAAAWKLSDYSAL